MFAIVDIKGKQYQVKIGDKVVVSRMEGKEGDKVSFDRVLLVFGDKTAKIGDPTVKGSKVGAKIVSHTKGKKVDIRRYKNKVRYRKHIGFRPQETTLEILTIS